MITTNYERTLYVTHNNRKVHIWNESGPADSGEANSEKSGTLFVKNKRRYPYVIDGRIIGVAERDSVLKIEPMSRSGLSALC